jgi:1-deoxy-D-xylulose-5-phosphate synthase
MEGTNMDEYFKEEIKKMEYQAEEIRQLLIETVSKNGGHLASNLGVVEVTLALHKIFDFSKDKLLFDVGHQSYVHKILTGRMDRFTTLRTRSGIGPFMDPIESEADPFISGHAGTGLAAAAGIALANPDDRVIVVVGDASVANGHSLEALNNIGGRYKNIIVVLNDNEMSIGENVGSLSKFFGKLMISEKYMNLRDEVKSIINKVRKANMVLNTLERMEISIKNFFFPLSVLESLGYKYFGTLDGHNIEEMMDTFKKAKRLEGPIFIHVKTQKGKGYHFAEEDKEKFHGISPFNLETGDTFSNNKTYSNVFAEEILELGKKDKDIIAITAGMVKGTGLEKFFEEFPERGIDVGISEGYAVTFAGGLAKYGKKPYVCIYSTFIQRGFSQIIHDISLQKLPVKFIVDRAGIVGEDGKTHNGLYDLNIFLTIPNYAVVSPTTSNELREAINFSVTYDAGPIAIRIPREVSFQIENDEKFILGKWKIIKCIGNIDNQYENIFIATGSMLKEILDIENLLLNRGINGTIISAASIKPLDEKFLLENLWKYKNIFVLEESYQHNSFGSYILNFLNDKKINRLINKIGIEVGLIPHGKRSELLMECRLKGEKLLERIEEQLNANEPNNK